MSSVTRNLKDYLLIKEAAAFIGVSEGTLRNWGRQGKIPTHRHPINTYRLNKRGGPGNVSGGGPLVGESLRRPAGLQEEVDTHFKAPRVGMLAKVRNRRGVIASVEPFDGAGEGRLHLVRIEYTDSDGILEDTILWEREESTDLLEPQSLPRVGAEPRMDPAEFDALVRACTERLGTFNGAAGHVILFPEPEVLGYE